MRVQKYELRIYICLDREFAQQSRAKAMNRRDDRPIQRPLMPHPANALGGCCRLKKFVQLSSETLAHLIRRAISEGYCDDLIYTDVLRAQNMQIALDEHGCLARPGARRNRNVPVEGSRRQYLFRLQFASVALNHDAHNSRRANLWAANGRQPLAYQRRPEPERVKVQTTGHMIGSLFHFCGLSF